jgi:hypothetical protein
LLFRFEPTNEQHTPEQLQEMHNQWGGFIGNIATQGKLVSTHQLEHVWEFSMVFRYFSDKYLAAQPAILRHSS